MSERRGRFTRSTKLSKTRRCELLDVARSSAYYRGEPASEADLAVMRLIDEISSPVAVLRQPADA